MNTPIINKLNWKLLQLPDRNIKQLAKQIKPDLQGVMIKDNQLYITDSFYAFSRPIEAPDGFISAIDGITHPEHDLTLTNTLKQMFESSMQAEPNFSLSVEILENILAIAKLQIPNRTNKHNRIDFYIPKDPYKPLLAKQGVAEYLIMPMMK